MNSLALPRLLKASNETMPHLVKARASRGLLSLVAMKMTIKKWYNAVTYRSSNGTMIRLIGIRKYLSYDLIAHLPISVCFWQHGVDFTLTCKKELIWYILNYHAVSFIFEVSARTFRCSNFFLPWLKRPPNKLLWSFLVKAHRVSKISNSKYWLRTLF